MSLTRSMFSRKFFLINLVLIGIMIGFAAAFVVLAGGGQDGSPAVASAEAVPSSIPVSDAIAHAKAMQIAFNNVAETVLPSVVELDVVGTVKESPADQSPWRFFFGDPGQAPEERQAPRQYQEEGLGSGIVVRRDGKKVYVLTNNHVVTGASSITVKLYDEREFKGSVLGTDERRDLALVVFETDDKDIKVARLGNSEKVRVGDWAIAIGSPFGLFSSVTAGIVSAIGRDGGPDGNISDFIQTDAAINKGNSGGALANIDGEIIGINTWIASTTGGSVGLGFSIPINNASKVISDIVAKGSVSYGWLGVLLSDQPKVTLEAIGVAERKGAFVGHVFTDGPGGKAGIQPGDFVTSVDGKPVASVDQLVRIVGDLPVGSKTSFGLVRGGKQTTLTVTIEERKEQSAADYSKLWPGLEVTPITPDIRKELKLAEGVKGLVVSSVIARSPAAALGLKTGDVLVKMNDKPVRDMAAFYGLLNDSRAKSIQFEVEREGQTLTTLALVRK